MFDKIEGPNKTVETLKTLAGKYGFEVLDYSQDPDFLGNVSYVYDKDHLNAVGAEIFTKKVAEKIRNQEKLRNQEKPQ